MQPLSTKLRAATGNRILFWCPGCNSPHMIIQSENGWTWNGKAEKPAFHPSILVRRDYGDPPMPQVCHSFVIDGKIQFLSDCTHSLVDQTVEVPDWGRQ